MNEQERKRLGRALGAIRRRIGSLRKCGVPGVEADLKAAELLVDQALYSVGVHPPRLRPGADRPARRTK